MTKPPSEKTIDLLFPAEKGFSTQGVGFGDNTGHLSQDGEKTPGLLPV